MIESTFIFIFINNVHNQLTESNVILICDFHFLKYLQFPLLLIYWVLFVCFQNTVEIQIQF